MSKSNEMKTVNKKRISKTFVTKMMEMLILVSLLVLTGCNTGKEPAAADSDIYIYYLNNEKTKLLSVDYSLQSERSDTKAAVDELLKQLEVPSKKLEYEVPFSHGVDLKSYYFENHLLTLDFDGAYRDVDTVREILVRAAIVRTLTQIPGVHHVSFLVEGKPLTDAHEDIVGNMNADTFIYNAGKEINAYERIQLTLYFANEKGDALRSVYRSVVYNSNISMERLVVDQIIKGPQNNISHPTINPATQVLTVNVRDGICYVDVDEAILVKSYPVTPEVTLYSIVNSLAELNGINKVQLTVNGSSDIVFLDTVNLSNVLERNLDIIEK